MTTTNWLYTEIIARTSLFAPDFASRPDADEKIKAFLWDAYDNRNATNFFPFIQKHLRTDRSVGEIEKDNIYHELNDFLVALFTRSDFLYDGGPIEAVHEILGGRIEVILETSSGDALEGGSVVFRNEDGSYTLEHTEGPERDNPEKPQPWDTFQVRVIPIPGDVYAEHDWVKDVPWERRLDGRSRNVRRRAAELIRIGEEHGWMELDYHPIQFSGRELSLRWGLSNWDEDSADDVADDCVLPEDSSEEHPGIVTRMYLALAWCDQNKRDFMDFVKQAMALRRRAKGKSTSDSSFDWMSVRVLKIMNEYGPSGIDTRMEDLKGSRLYIRTGQDMMVGLTYDGDRREWVVEQGPVEPVHS